MTNVLKTLSESNSWHLLVNAAKRGAQEHGFVLSRVPGRGLSNVYNIEMSGRTEAAAIRTTRDRWIAFPPLAGGKKWKTLDGVEKVIVAAVDSRESPTAVEVYVFPAKEIRRRFDAAYQARIAAGNAVKDNFGMWVGLDKIDSGSPNSVGSGIVDHYRPIAVYPIAELLAASAMGDAPATTASRDLSDLSPAPMSGEPRTITDVMAWARQRIAEIAGARLEAVKLDLKLEL